MTWRWSGPELDNIHLFFCNLDVDFSVWSVLLLLCVTLVLLDVNFAFDLVRSIRKKCLDCQLKKSITIKRVLLLCYLLKIDKP